MLFIMLFMATASAKDIVNLDGRPLDELGERFEARNYGFAPPYSPNLHWSLAGLAMITPQRVILTRDLPSLYGAIWNKNPVQMRDWMAVVNFRIMSAANHHADGMAIWYTEKTGVGKAYGAPHNFSGIALDTYSNYGNNDEKITVLLGRGNEEFNADDDGKSLSLNDRDNRISCDLPRNRMFTSVSGTGTSKILVRYYEDTLSVYYAGVDENSWTLCGGYDGLLDVFIILSVFDILLPLGYYFGVSADTGDLHSSHEIISIKMFSLAGKHDSDAPMVPSAASIVKSPDTEDAHRGLSPNSTWWTAFKVSAYSAFIAVTGMLLVLIYKELANPKRRQKKFY